MSKNELLHFRNKYLKFLKSYNYNKNVCDWLENAVDYERPDGYYFDSNSSLLVIFEHFEIDCSERIMKKNKSQGSSLRKNYNDKYQEVQKEIEVTDDFYESTKVIEQGYYEQNGNTKTFYIGKDGDKYRNNFIDNFSESFKSHNNNIEKYKKRIIEELKIQPKEIKIIFLIEDKTVMGSYYLNEKKSFGEPVILTDTLQFQETINKSDVDYVITGRQQDKMSSIGYKGDTANKIDLCEKEFFIIPAPILFTASKKRSIKEKTEN